VALLRAARREGTDEGGAMENLVALLSGGLFGFALDKAKTNVPWVVSAQMGMTNFTMMRMFLAASATSTAVVLLLDRLGLVARKPKAGLKLGLGIFGGYGANFVGGALLGMGMYLTGSCPGTIWAQIGANTVPHLGSVVAGGVVGTLIFGYTERFMRARKGFHEATTDSDASPRWLGYPASALLLTGAMVGAIAGFNHFFPWQQEHLAVLAPSTAAPEAAAQLAKDAFPLDPAATTWDPALSGLLLGLLQVPGHLTCNGPLGQSSGWVFLTGHLAGLLDKNLDKHAPYLITHRTGRKSLAQVIIAAGIMGGAALSQYLSGYPALSAEASQGCGDFTCGFVGGALLLFGSRLGGGCTSGHGLSGMATVSIASILTVVGMFAGGMSLAFFPRSVIGL